MGTTEEILVTAHVLQQSETLGCHIFSDLATQHIKKKILFDEGIYGENCYITSTIL